MKRRTFVRTASMAAAGLALKPAFSKGKDYRIGLQLYTLRDIIFKDPKGVLKMATDLGYQDFEVFGYNDGKLFGMPVKEFTAYVKSLGARITSGHYSFGKDEMFKGRTTVLNGWDQAVVDAKEAGQEFMVLAHLTKNENKTLDDYKFVCEKLNQAGEVCRKEGIKLQYHNHDFEFNPIDGQVPFDLMLKELDPRLVSIELDLFWITYAGYQPADYFKKYPGRFEQWHVKDMDKNDRKKNADVGTGTMDFKSLFGHAEESGLKHFYIEHDSYPSSSTESVKADVKNIKAILQ
ncbi:MAG: sugar phosphate isomerase/epimerase [Bacteroidetes bacterium]|nr:sugar phosphate isomerase/epimerase [Bacteroidota bacterium]